MDVKRPKRTITCTEQQRPLKLLLTALVVLFLAIVGLTGGVAAATDDGFAVEMNETAPTVPAGETVSVSATVTNTGDSEESQQIHLKRFDGAVVDSVADPPLTLAPDERESVVLQWETSTADIGNGTISVQSNDHFPTRNLTVVDPTAVDTAVDAEADSLAPGETLTVPVTVTNTGEYDIETRAWIAHNNTELSNQTVAVDAGESKAVNMTWTPTAEDVGSMTVTTGTAYGETNHTVTVAHPSDSDADGDDNTDSSSSGDGTSPNVADQLREPVTDGTATFAGGDIRQITFTNTSVSGDVVATRLHDQPDDVDTLQSSVAFYRITVPDDATDHNATIEFELSDEIYNNETETLGVSHWNGTDWNSLNSSVSNSSSGEVTLTAETAGFSVFALTATEMADDASTTTETNSSVDTAESDDTDGGLIERAVTAGGVGFLLLVGTVGVLLVTIGSVGMLLATRQRGVQ